jgi:curli production assembly/transport component CsgG
MKFLIILLTLIVSGCAITQKAGVEYKPQVAENKLQREFDTLPSPNGKRVVVAVYSFLDKTGQRRPTAGIASLSTAVTQGAEVFLIKALQDVGKGNWFEVVERVGIDSLTRERTLIRQMREAYEGVNAKPLMPMQFAGLIMEGGIIGYDSGTESGGAAYRFLGIGPQTQYSKDTVTVSLRAVSVNTGKVLAAVTVTKIVYSTADSIAVLKFLNQGTQAFEAEMGLTINEPGTLAVKATVEAAVVELIKEGERKGIWDFKKADSEPVAVVSPPVAVVSPPVAVVSPPVVVASPVVPVADVSTKMYANVSGVFLRKEPEESKSVIKLWWLGLGEEVEVVSTFKDDWVSVKVVGTDKKGWVKKTLLSTEKP